MEAADLAIVLAPRQNDPGVYLNGGDQIRVMLQPPASAPMVMAPKRKKSFCVVQ